MHADQGEERLEVGRGGDGAAVAEDQGVGVAGQGGVPDLGDEGGRLILYNYFRRCYNIGRH